MASPLRTHCTASLVLLAIASGAGAQPRSEAPPPPQSPIREIYVPFEDLNVILDNDKQRVFLTRDEYDDLLRQAQARPRTPAPRQVVLLAADYRGRIANGHVQIRGELTIEVLEEGLFALPLPLAGVGIRSAELDDRPAPLVQPAGGAVALLVRGQGQHKLILDLTAPLQTAAAQQSLQLTLPTQAATRLFLTVAGNVEVQGGAAVIRRTFDEPSQRTAFELVPQHGSFAVALSLNNRRQQAARVMVARSVIVAEITQGYERLHATVAYRVLHGSVEKVQLELPAAFEVTAVESVRLARWEIQPGGEGTKRLEMTLQGPTAEPFVLHLAAQRSAGATEAWLAQLAEWQFPRLVPLETSGHVAVLGLVLEDRLRMAAIEPQHLLPLDATALAAAIPASVLQAEPGAPRVRQVASYFAPGGGYQLAARFERLPGELEAVANLLLLAGDEGLALRGGLALKPQAEGLHRVAFLLPAGWQLAGVSSAAGAPLPAERFPAPEGATRVVVPLPQSVRIGQTGTIHFHATRTPAGWLGDWTTQTIDVPQVRIDGATAVRGALGVQTTDDLEARPLALAGLAPLLDREKAALGLGEFSTALAYRFDEPGYSARLSIERKTPSLAAEVYSLVRLAPDTLSAAYEVHYDVRAAHVRQVAFTLPATTPAELAIRGLDATAVKEFSSQIAGDRRRWTVQLAERKLGDVRLAVEFTQRLPDVAQQNYPLPLVEAAGVEHQSGLAAVEGHPELDIRLATAARPVDVGELSGAEFSLGRRVIGAFGYQGTQAPIRATIVRRAAYALPPALVQRAELLTSVAASGLAQSVARYDLLTKATLLEIRLPASAALWTIYLDDQPTKPQREGDSLLLSLPAQPALAIRKLQIVYESRVSPLGLTGTVSTVAPQLLVRAKESDREREIPQADLRWELILPDGYRVRWVGGTVEAENPPRRPLAATTMVRGLLGWTARSVGSLGGTPPVASAPDRMEYLHAQQQAQEGQSYGLATGGARPPAKTQPMDEAALLAQQPPTMPPGTAAPPGAVPPPEAAGPPAASAPAARHQRAETVAAPRDAYASWALQGVSSLKIDIEPGNQPAAAFHSLGDAPVLQVRVAADRRLRAAAWTLALVTLLVGLRLSTAPGRQQARYVLVLLLVSTVPLLVTSYFDEVADALDFVFFAACGLAAYYLVLAAVRAVLRRRAARARSWSWSPAAGPAALTLLVIALGAVGPPAQAHEPGGAEDLTPVAVPKDAIIVPYDPTQPLATGGAERILVPYARYVELWNRAFPDKPIDAVPPPHDFALAGTQYEAALGADNHSTLSGTLLIDVYRDQPVTVPLVVGGGVVARATVDGQAAQLLLADPAAPVPEPSAAPRQRAAQPASLPAPAADSLPPRMFLLRLAGKGRKQLELEIRLGLVRQGGWRVVRGLIPAGPAAALLLRAPDAGTEVRLAGVSDLATRTTHEPGERIETVLGPGGRLDLRWRPRVAEAAIDQALTARSTAVFDVREDAFRLAWQMRLEFGRNQRESFILYAPEDYLIEQVVGDNLRGWTATRVAGEQEIEVTLLKPAQGSQTLTLHLARRRDPQADEPASFDAPAIRAEGAALEQGELTVRRSPRLELRTLAAEGLSRADAGREAAALLQAADQADAAVLVVRPYQSFRFVRLPYQLTLAAAPAPTQATAEVRAALRIAERETTLDAAITLRPQGQPLYEVNLQLPAEFVLDRLGPGDWEWSLTRGEGSQRLTVYLLDGRTNELTLTLLGKLPAAAALPAAQPTTAAPAAAAPPAAQPSAPGAPATRTAPLPQIEVLNVERQQGEIVIIPDPDIDVRLENVSAADAAPLATPPAWLQSEQQALARAVLHFRASGYSATIVLVPRQPVVTCRTITNVKVTPRAIEETLLVTFRIEQAGVRRLEFLVPQHLAAARLKARLLRQKLVEPATTASGQALAGWVRVTLELQDYVRGEYVVILEHDRLLSADRQTVALPVIETGRTDRRLLALENAGRDELVIAPADVAGLAPVTRHEQAWRDLTAVLGTQLTQAYAALDSAERPQLAFSLLRRQEAERSRARIGLATTALVVDASGAYRAEVEYRVTNSSEQYLELALPAGARLWTATVAGEPVKPSQAIPPQPQVVRIPLVKTAEGEGDYPVELKYGGRIPLSAARSIDFPLIRQTSIHVELSHVRLWLPKSHRWLHFGGTMRRVEDDSELAAGFQTYLNKRIQDAVQSLSTASDYAKVRAAVNLKQARELLDQSRVQLGDAPADGGRAAGDLALRNEALLRQAEQQAQLELGQQQAAQPDNRQRLNEYFFRKEQEIERSKNVVTDLASNFDAALGQPAPQNGAVNRGWFEQNKLQSADSRPLAEPRLRSRDDRLGAADGAQRGRYLRGGQQLADQPDAASQPPQALPQIAGMKEVDELERRLDRESAKEDRGGARQSQLRRYQESLEQSAAQSGPVPGAEQLGFAPAGRGPQAGGFSGGAPGPGQAALPQRQANAPFGALAPSSGEQLALVTAGLASLDVQLPERGELYRFTTPRGAVEITARAVPTDTLNRLSRLLLVLVAAAAGLVVLRRTR